MLILLLLAQVAVPSAVPADSVPRDSAVYASDAVREVVTRAAERNRRVPRELRSYRARVESEIALVLAQPGGYELTAQLEQVASDVDWRRTGAMEQRVVGYRAQSSGANISALTYLRQAWTVPVLYGNRLSLFFGRDSARARRSPGDSARDARRAVLAVHPLADDRERVYHYSGGDTVATLQVGGRALPIVRVRVQPRGSPDRRTLVFDGEMDLDITRHQLVRLRGQFLDVGGRRSLVSRLRAGSMTSVLFLELVNREVNERFWLPAYQRIEAQASWLFGGDARAVFRVVTRFGAIVPDDTVFADTSAAGADDLAAAAAREGDTLVARPHRLTIAPGDSLRRFGGWSAPLGAATSEVGSDDYAELAPEAWKPTGRPRLDARPERLSELVRFNKVEGLYLAAPVRLRLRDVAPGVTLRLQGGRAFAEDAWRGSGSIAFARGAWRAGLRGGRTLASTADFLGPWDDGLRIGPLLSGEDELDYVDRRFGTAWVERGYGRMSALRLEAGPASDRPARRSLRRAGLFGAPDDGFTHNRYAAPGDYVRGAAVLEVNREVGDGFVRPGVGARLSHEKVLGALAFERSEARVSARRLAGPFTVAGRVHAGVVRLADTVPQQLYELGEREGLPGYASKRFGGDRVALGRATVMYTTPWLRAPIPLRVFRARYFLPGVAPSLAASVQGGWSDASTGIARAALVRLGTINDPVTGRPVADPESRLRAPVPTGGVRSTVELSLRLFAGAVAFGIARPVDHAGDWRFVFRMGEEM